MNTKIKSKLLNYCDNNQNSLDIYIGKLQNKTVFKKNVEQKYFNKCYQTIQMKNYKFTKFNRTIYNYVNDYLTLEDKQYISKSNILPISFNNKLFAFYNRNEKHFTEFSNKKNYNKIQQKVDKFQVNEEVNVLFINNNQIKITVDLNHNIDNTIPVLEELIKILDK